MQFYCYFSAYPQQFIRLTTTQVLFIQYLRDCSVYTQLHYKVLLASATAYYAENLIKPTFETLINVIMRKVVLSKPTMRHSYLELTEL